MNHAEYHIAELITRVHNLYKRLPVTANEQSRAGYISRAISVWSDDAGIVLDYETESEIASTLARTKHQTKDYHQQLLLAATKHLSFPAPNKSALAQDLNNDAACAT